MPLSPLNSRPVTIVGTGSMAKLIGLTLAARGGIVRIWGRRPHMAIEVKGFIDTQVPDLVTQRGGDYTVGSVEIYDDLALAIQGAGLVIETVSEDPQLKRSMMAELDRMADPDAVISSNSSSIPVASYVDDLTSPDRVLNVHFHNPPYVNAVDLLSSGSTRPEIIEHLEAELPKYGLVPFVSTKPNAGFPFNRMMEAWFREALQIVADGASSVEQVDGIWMVDTGMPFGPFGMMDQVGLDVVAEIEKLHRVHNPTLAQWLSVETLEPYIAAGKLGLKSGEGFYRYDPHGARRTE